MRSYKTTVAGVLTLAGAVISALLQYFSDGSVNLEQLGLGITAGLGLLAARDNDVSSQDVGIRPITGRR